MTFLFLTVLSPCLVCVCSTKTHQAFIATDPPLNYTTGNHSLFKHLTAKLHLYPLSQQYSSTKSCTELRSLAKLAFSVSALLFSFSVVPEKILPAGCLGSAVEIG